MDSSSPLQLQLQSQSQSQSQSRQRPPPLQDDLSFRDTHSDADTDTDASEDHEEDDEEEYDDEDEEQFSCLYPLALPNDDAFYRNSYDEDYDEDVLLPPPSWILDCMTVNNTKNDGNINNNNNNKDKDETNATVSSKDTFHKDKDALDAKTDTTATSNTNTNTTPDTTTTTSTTTTYPPPPLSSPHVVGPSWKEQIQTEFSTTLPLAARELVQKSFRTIVYQARISYAARGLKYHINSDLGNTSGYIRPAVKPKSSSSSYYTSTINSYEATQSTQKSDVKEEEEQEDNDYLPPFSSLSWVDRQLVKEWRTIGFKNKNNHNNHSNSNSLMDDEDYEDYELARIIVPKPITRPPRKNATHCQTCHRIFDKTLSRHHCRLCGGSFCHNDSSLGHKLPHLDYRHDVPERVCDGCKTKLVERDLAERVAWRMARCRDFLSNDLTPYFETGVDTVEDAAIRIARATIRMAKQIPLGAQATVAVETVDVLRKHGLKGVYGIVLRKEFLAAADLLCKVTGINKRSWPLSVHELSAAIFYALAQHRGLRGNDPEREEWMHTLMDGIISGHGHGHGNGGGATLRGTITKTISGLNLNLDAGKQRWTAEDVAMEDKEEFEEEDCVKNAEEKKEDHAHDSDHSSSHSNDDHKRICNHSEPSLSHEEDIVNETDVYNPMEQSYADLLVMADLAIKANRDKDKDNDNVHHEPIHKKETKLKGMNVSNDNYFSNTETRSPKQKLQIPISPPPSSSSPPPSPSPPSSSHQEPPQHKRPPRPENPVCSPVSDSLLSSLLFYAPIAMNFIYCTNAVDMQLLAAQQNWHLLYAHLEQDATLHDRPASALFVHRDQKIACFAVRGTATINDVVTDIRAMPVPFPDDPLNGSFEDDWMPVDRGQGLALCGMSRSAGHLFREHIDSLVMLAEQGYRLRFTGHSLGGGVAALLGALVYQFFEKRTQAGEDSLSDTIANKKKGKSVMDHNDLLRVYTYAIPACVDAKLADFCASFVTSVVCHDDVIPRLTPTSIRALLKHLLHIRKTWVKAHLGEDINQIADRLKGGWAPRWRAGFTLMHQNPKTGQLRNTAKSSSKWVKQTMKHYKSKLHSAKSKLIGVGKIYSAHESKEVKDDEAREVEEDDDEGGSLELKSQPTSYLDSPKNLQEFTSSDMNRFLNGETYSDAAHYGMSSKSMFDGDYFYETSQSEHELLEEEDEDEEAEYDTYHQAYGELFSAHHGYDSNKKGKLSSVAEEDEWVPFDEPAMEIPPISDCWSECEDDKNTAESEIPKEDDNANTAAPVMLEEMNLPRMFIPGKIVHIYTHNGGYKAACVPRTFRELRRISLAGNMLSDHTCKAYYEAMLEVRSIRQAPKPLPEWTGFGEDVTCSCCASPFTWASTSNTEAQEARDKHNCRACGTLVCDTCSKNRIPLPQIGLEVPLRVCDRCYYDLGATLNEESENSLTMSFLKEKDSNNFFDTEDENDENSKEKQTLKGSRSRRNLVVDELASRIKSSPIYG